MRWEVPLSMTAPKVWTAQLCSTGEGKALARGDRAFRDAAVDSWSVQAALTPRDLMGVQVDANTSSRGGRPLPGGTGNYKEFKWSPS